MAEITLNDASFYYEQHGEGHDLVLISGYTVRTVVWLPLVDRLKKHFKVTLFDNRGVGQTKDGHAELTAELMAKDVIELSKALSLNKPHILGQSMGGTIAQTIAINKPEAISKLILCATSAKWREAIIKTFDALYALREKNIDFELLFNASIPWVYGEAFLTETDLDEFKTLAENDPYPQSLEGQARQMNVLKTFDSRASLSQITAPTLICSGSEDVISLMEEQDFLLEHIAQSRQQVFECAHGIPNEVTDELADAIIAFCLND